MEATGWGLDETVESVASVTESWHDVAVFVETLIESAENNRDVLTFHGLFKRGKTFGGSEDADCGDLSSSAVKAGILTVFVEQVCSFSNMFTQLGPRVEAATVARLDNQFMRKISTRTVYTNPWMSVREDEVIRDDGSVGLFGVVEKRDFSLVLPSYDGGFFLVEQYRYPALGRYWEFPQGTIASFLDASTPREVASVELAEETGITAKNMAHIGTVHEAYGYATPRAHIFLATDLLFGEPTREATESDMRCQWFSQSALWKLVDRGLLTDAPSLAALALLQRYNDRTIEYQSSPQLGLHER